MSSQLKRDDFSKVKRVVIKAGTSTLAYDTGLLNIERMERLVREISDIHSYGIDVVLVSSGAIGAGMGRLGLLERPKDIPSKQAAAAIGQGVLVHMYSKLFSEYGKISGQILLTKDVIKHPEMNQNAQNAFQALFDHKVIPVVNENDAVAIDEIKIGDNDTLSAIVATIVDADLLIILSDIDGLYDKNPNKYQDAKLISEVETIDDEIRKMAGGTEGELGTGGMKTKIDAAEITAKKNIPTVIASGSDDGIIRDIIKGKDKGTVFWGI